MCECYVGETKTRLRDIHAEIGFVEVHNEMTIAKCNEFLSEMPKKGLTRVKQSASKSSKLNPLYAEKSWAATHAKFVK
jgi:hypothetical protein